MKNSVLKAFGLAILMLIASVLLIMDLALSNPLHQKHPFIAQASVANSSSAATQPSETPTAQPVESSASKDEVAKRSQPSTDSQTNPQAIREKASVTPPADARSQPTKPRNKDAFDAFNRALYGS